jgi:hypothetical protein
MIESKKAQSSIITLNSKTNSNSNEDPKQEPILKIICHAGYNLQDKELFNETTMNSLPKWSKVTSFYGPPKILGSETCQAFPNQVAPLDRWLGVAGTFNSGTNLLYDAK